MVSGDRVVSIERENILIALSGCSLDLQTIVPFYSWSFTPDYREESLEVAYSDRHEGRHNARCENTSQVIDEELKQSQLPR